MLSSIFKKKAQKSVSPPDEVKTDYKSLPLLDRFNLLVDKAAEILPEYKFKWPQMEWWNHQDFNIFLKRFNEYNGFNTDRKWSVLQLLRLVEEVPGATAECGVYTGATSFLIAKANESSKREALHYMFDSFEGLSEPDRSDGEHWTAGDLACDMKTVQSNLKDCANLSFHKGWIPERFCDVENEKFAFVHIDVDLERPTADSISFFYSRMSDGGIIVCDDYGFTSCPGATKAIDNFLQDKPEAMISLSGGGGFFIKGITTSKSAPSYNYIS